MAGVFKSLDKSDIRVTPFRTYKLWADTIGEAGSGSVYTIYQANYNPISNYPQVDFLKDTFDQGNPYFDAQELTTSDGKFQRVVHASINHLYYRDFYQNNKASFGSGNINRQFRFLEDKAQVVSMPQSKFGEAILPGSITMTVSWSLAITGSMTTSGLATVVDDLFGNLYVTGGILSPYNQTIGGAFTNYSSSVSKNPVGEWPFDDLYKYINVGLFNHTSSFNRGYWQMESLYTNVSSSFLSGGYEPYPTDKNLLGAVLFFTASQNSRIEVKPSVEPAYRQYYNFENDDFAISMMVMPTAYPTHISGSTLITKQGTVDELRVDDNGNVYTKPVPTKAPYRITYASESLKVKFEKYVGYDLFALTSSISMSLNNLHHVMVSKTGSLVTLYVSNYLTSSSVSASYTFPDKHSSNESNIYIGNNHDNSQGFTGVIDNVKIYKNKLSSDDAKILHHTLGVGNTIVGNAFYNHGMMTLTSPPMQYSIIKTVSTRGTHTIWEKEVSCTVGPGEFGMSMHPSLQEWDPSLGEYKYKALVTGSAFRPFITTIGLYNDYGQLLVIGKLNTPIQTPNNMDTTFIIRYDR